MSPEESIQPPGKRPIIALAGALVFVTAALLVYANTMAFAWDEGYHLVAAWLIAHGKRPYLDFLFPQTPLNAYWNAFLLRTIRESWHVPHTAAALLTSGATVMASLHVYRRLEASQSWRIAAAIVTAFTMELNVAVYEFGTLQAYGVCLFMIVAAYILTVESVDQPGALRPGLAGLCTGIAASSSLLSAPVSPILLMWMIIVNREGRLVKKVLAWIAGVVIAFIPLIRLLIESPRQVIFGFLQYELLFRKVEWDDATIHNIGEAASFGDSPQAVLLVLLAIAGLVLLRKRIPSARMKSELWLCLSLGFFLSAYLMTARPTFTRYYLMTVPFFSIAAAVGLYEVMSRLSTRPRPILGAAIICVITTYCLAASLFEQRDDLAWKDVEKTAAKVKQVTPPNAVLLADEPVYFLLHRMPPTGMELEDSHKLRFSNADALALHVVPRRKLDLMIKSHRFDTVEMCDDDEISRIGLEALYAKNETAGTCKVFWQWKQASGNSETSK